MFAKNKKHTLFKLFLAGTCMMTLAAPVTFASYQAHAATAYDISEYQGYLTPYQVRRLKSEVSFVVIRAQDGGLTTDSTFEHNVRLLKRYNIPYGVYSYSLYANPAQAKAEAEALHRRAPDARFYVNDMEQNNTDGTLNASTKAWAREIHRVSNRPAVLYSGEYFMTSNVTQETRNNYDAIWLAAYGEEPDPYYHYDLWQFSSDYYSRALGRALDADTFPDGNNKSLNFWIGNSSKTGPTKRRKSTVKPTNNDTANAIINAKNAAIAKQKEANAKSKSQISNLKNTVADYQNKANTLAKDASSQKQEIQQLQNENHLQSEALEEDTKKLRSDDSLIATLKNKLAHAEAVIRDLMHRSNTNIPKPSSPFNKHAKTSKKAKARIPSKYYKRVSTHFVRVVSRGGINIYDHNDNKKIAHVNRGTILHVLYCKAVRYKGGEITRAIGDYGWNSDSSPRQVVFTSSKNFVRACHY